MSTASINSRMHLVVRRSSDPPTAPSPATPTPDHIGISSPGNSYFVNKIANFQLHQIQQLRIVHHVHLVQKHHDVRHTHLTRQQNVLARLRHRTIRRRSPPDIAPSICAAPVIMFLT